MFDRFLYIWTSQQIGDDVVLSKYNEFYFKIGPEMVNLVYSENFVACLEIKGEKVSDVDKNSFLALELMRVISEKTEEISKIKVDKDIQNSLLKLWKTRKRNRLLLGKLGEMSNQVRNLEKLSRKEKNIFSKKFSIAKEIEANLEEYKIFEKEINDKIVDLEWLYGILLALAGLIISVIGILIAYM